MAVIQYSALVTSVKGRLRGAIFQSGPGGQIVRSAGNFNRSNNPRWNRQKNVTQVVAQAWSGLTTNQQNAWNAMAQNLPTKNKFGEKRLASGYNVFMKANQIALGGGATIITDPSMPIGLSDQTGTFIGDNVVLFLRLVFPNPLLTNEIVLIDGSAPVRNGRRQPPGGWKRIYNGPLTSDHVDLATPYKNVFGTIILLAPWWGRAFVFNQVTGQKSTPYLFQVIPQI